MRTGLVVAKRRFVTSSIAEYAIIGDCRSAALVSRMGSVDWLCWPRFDSPSIFARLLDEARGGSWRIAPVGRSRASRRYVEDTAVLQTTFETATGSAVLVDAMPVVSPEDEERLLSPEHELVRRITCTRGHVEIEVVFDPRPDYACGRTRWHDRGAVGICIETAKGLLTFRSDLKIPVPADGAARVRTTMREGETLDFSLAYAVDTPAVLSPLGTTSREALRRTIELWQEWGGRTRYVGPYREYVVRSAITIKLLTYAPSGASVAAATTSLPERPGGDHNWDYRFCWLRDAAFTVRGLLALGHRDEAEAFVSWLLHATRSTQPKLNVLYDVFGRSAPKERVLGQLAGFGGARPVRTGNAADAQLQLDAYGEVIDAVWRITRSGRRLDRETSRVITGFGLHVCRHWREPDHGIWEPRTGRRWHTHSLALCWTALARLLDLQRTGEIAPRHHELFAAEAARIRSVVEQSGFDLETNSYTSELGGKDVDASALLLPWYGFVRHDSPRMRGTFERILRELSPRRGLLYRYTVDRAGDGAFGISSFWAAEHLARGGGSERDARATFESTLRYANDVGLFAEEIDPATGAPLGNFPQTFTHVGLINAALSIAELDGGDAGRRDAA